jgi:quercetin dioxygenase-like cupin family protein
MTPMTLPSANQASPGYPTPLYLAKPGEASAAFRSHDLGHDLEMGPGGTRTSYLATGHLTGGQFGLYQWDMSAAGGGPSPHFHRTISESFYITQGAVSLYNGEEWRTAVAGDFLYVPPGGIHAFHNESGEPASMLILFTPGAPREAYFEALAQVRTEGRTMSPEEEADLLRRHDQYPVT